MSINAILSNPGVYLNQTDGSWEQNNKNFLKYFIGEVFTAFNAKNIMRDLHRERTIEHGKSASFPAIGSATADYHVPGSPILGGNKFNHGEITINVDDLLIAAVAVYNLDEAKNHFDVRQEYSRQLGIALADAWDKKCLQVAILAARAAGFLPETPGGSRLVNPALPTDGKVLASAISQCAELMDEKNVPEADRSVILRPAQYHLLVRTTDVLHKDWGGQGSYAEGELRKIDGVAIRKSNHVPKTVITAKAGENNKYDGDFSKTVGVCFQREAIGTVKLKDLTVQKTGDDFNAVYQADLMLAKYAVGHGILRPECAVELVTEE